MSTVEFVLAKMKLISILKGGVVVSCYGITMISTITTESENTQIHIRRA